ncbi:CASP-like protein POPTRDRAFT_818956 isoform 2, partial [Theobroma cacao]
MNYLGVGVSPGNVPVYHATNLKVIDRRVRVAELVLRCVICVLSVLAAVLVATDTQVKEIFSIQKKARFTDMKALVFGGSQWGSCSLLIDTRGALCCGYGERKCAFQQAFCLGHFLWRSVNRRLMLDLKCWSVSWYEKNNDLMHQTEASRGFENPTNAGVERRKSCRKMLANNALAYLTVAAVGAAAQSAVFGKLGQTELQWLKICSMYG